MAKIRETLQDWRARKYQDASDTPRSLLEWWFEREHLLEQADGSTYTPDFLVKDTDGGIWIIETQGRGELDLPQEMARLRQWCGDTTEASREDGGLPCRFLYVDQEGFTRHAPKTLQALAEVVRMGGLDLQGGGQIVPPLSLGFPTAGGLQALLCWHTEGLFRLIQSTPSPKAEPFKRWLARVGYARMQEIEDPEDTAIQAGLAMPRNQRQGPRRTHCLPFMIAVHHRSSLAIDLFSAGDERR